MKTSELTDSERTAIADAIRREEARTSGEIFCAIARSSDDYRHIPLLWASLVALTVPLPLILLTGLGRVEIVIAQLATFLVLGALLLLPSLRIAVVPAATKAKRVRRHALEQFLAHNIHATPGRTGVLLFLSLAERRAEVIADEAIHAVVDEDTWEAIADTLTEHAAKGQIAQGLLAGIALSGDLLATHFPGSDGDGNVLTDHVVEL